MGCRKFLLLCCLFLQFSSNRCSPLENAGAVKEFNKENGELLEERNEQRRSVTQCGCSNLGVHNEPCPRFSVCPDGVTDLDLLVCQPLLCIAECVTGGVTTYHCCDNCPEPAAPPPPPPPPSSPSPSPGGSVCFPSTARVSLESGKSITLSNLQVGDRVQTVNSGGELIYSEVKAFLQKDIASTALHNSIVTSSNYTVGLTGNHLIYARKSSSEKFNPINADQVSLGDEVLVQDKHQWSPETVINISRLTMQGAYVPLTMEGNIVVDGVLASCYASFNHDLSHFGVTAIRWFPGMIHLIFGEDNGIQAYVTIAKYVARLVLPVGSIMK